MTIKLIEKIREKRGKAVCFRHGVTVTGTPREKYRMMVACAKSLQDDGFDMYRTLYCMRHITKGGAMRELFRAEKK